MPLREEHQVGLAETHQAQIDSVRITSEQAERDSLGGMRRVKIERNLRRFRSPSLHTTGPY